MFQPAVRRVRKIVGHLWLLVPLAQPAFAVPITDFALFGGAELEVGASNVSGGLVGSAGPVTTGSGAAASLEGVRAGGNFELASLALATGNVIANGPVTLGAGSSVIGNVNVGEDLILESSALISGDAIAAGAIIKGSGSSIGGTESSGGSPLVFVPPSLPLASSFAAGGTDVNASSGLTTTLGPGTYGTLSLGSGNTLNLESGSYFFDSITVDSALLLNLDLSAGDLQIFVLGDGSFGSGLVTTLSGGTAANVFAETHGSWSLLQGSRFFGTLFAPNGDVTLGNAIELFGAAYAGYTVSLGNDSSADFVAANQLSVPEPQSLWLLLLALIGLWALRR